MINNFLYNLVNEKSVIKNVFVIFSSISTPTNNKMIWLRGKITKGDNADNWIKSKLRLNESCNENFKFIRGKEVLINGYWAKNGWTTIAQIWFNGEKIYELTPKTLWEKQLILKFKEFKPEDGVDAFFK